MNMLIRFWGDSDVGRRRSENQDHYICDEEQGLFAVSDGMGGLVFGKETAKEVLRLLQLFLSFEDLAELESENICELLKEMILEINEQIVALGNTKGKEPLYGATLSGVLFWTDYAFVFNVGDSRVYRLTKGGTIKQLTSDDSLLGSIQAVNIEIEAEAKKRAADILLQFMGMCEEICPEIQLYEWKKEEIFCICSDGLWEMVPDAMLEEVLSKESTPKEKVNELIERANEAGGKDNITVVVVEKE